MRKMDQGASPDSEAPEGVEIRRDGSVVSVLIDGTEQTRIDTDRPAQLEFEYMQQMTILLDCAIPEPLPVHAAHIGGCGCALAWAWDVRRPKSRQLAVEVDPWIAEHARTWFPLPRKPALRIRAAEGRAALEQSQATFDVIVRDAFVAASVPRHLQTVQWAGAIRSHLGERGLYLANCAHGAGTNCREDIAALQTVFPHTLAIGASKVLKGARWGNVVVAAWDHPGLLNPEEVDRQLRKLPLPVSVLHGKDLERWIAGASPAKDPETQDG